MQFALGLLGIDEDTHQLREMSASIDGTGEFFNWRSFWGAFLLVQRLDVSLDDIGKKLCEKAQWASDGLTYSPELLRQAMHLAVQVTSSCPVRATLWSSQDLRTDLSQMLTTMSTPTEIRIRMAAFKIPTCVEDWL